MISKVDELLQTLQGLLPMKPENKQKLDKKFRLEFNYNSNRIEGNTLSYGETELLLFFGDTQGNHTIREYEEMKGHDVALKLIEDWAADEEHVLTERDIKNLNQIILKEPFWKEAITPDGKDTRREIKIGDYKLHPNSVRLPNGEMFNYPSPVDTPILMQELIDWYRTEEKSLHPFTLAAMLHYKFVRIHPFDDGNGRIARLLMNYVLFRNNLQPLIIKSSDKQNYLRALHLADTGDYEPFINYIAEQEVWSLETSIKAAKGESIEEPEDIDKEIELLNKRLINKKVLTAEKSPELIYELLKHSIIPLFKALEEKCEKLKPLFMNYTRHVSYDSSDGNSNVLDTKKSDWNCLEKDWIENKIKLQNSSLNQLYYHYILEGLKSKLVQINIGFSLNYIFNPYSYTIRHNQNEISTHPYDKQISDKEKTEIVSIVIKEVIEQINNATDKA